MSEEAVGTDVNPESGDIDINTDSPCTRVSSCQLRKKSILSNNYLYNEKVSTMAPRSKELNQFRFLTYNILNEFNSQPTKFPFSSREYLPLSSRIIVIGPEVIEYQPDLICLQEVEKKHFETIFTPMLSEELNMEGKFAYKNDEAGVSDGQAIFYNTAKFEFVDDAQVFLFDYMKTLSFYPSIGYIMRERIAHSNLFNVFQVVALKAKGAHGVLLLVANFHQCSTPHADHMRLIQSMCATDFVQNKQKELMKRYPKLKTTVIFAGAMNSFSKSGSIRYLTSGKVDKDEPDWSPSQDENHVDPGIDWTHTFHLTDAYPDHELTNITRSFRECIDYIFYDEGQLNLVARYPPPSLKRIAEICGVPQEQVTFPNRQAPSDHLPLIVDFEFKKRVGCCCGKCVIS